MKIIVYLE